MTEFGVVTNVAEKRVARGQLHLHPMGETQRQRPQHLHARTQYEKQQPDFS